MSSWLPRPPSPLVRRRFQWRPALTAAGGGAAHWPHRVNGRLSPPPPHPPPPAHRIPAAGCLCGHPSSTGGGTWTSGWSLFGGRLFPLSSRPLSSALFLPAAPPLSPSPGDALSILWWLPAAGRSVPLPPTPVPGDGTPARGSLPEAGLRVLQTARVGGVLPGCWWTPLWEGRGGGGKRRTAAGNAPPLPRVGPEGRVPPVDGVSGRPVPCTSPRLRRRCAPPAIRRCVCHCRRCGVVVPRGGVRGEGHLLAATLPRRR